MVMEVVEVALLEVIQVVLMVMKVALLEVDTVEVLVGLMVMKVALLVEAKVLALLEV